MVSMPTVNTAVTTKTINCHQILCSGINLTEGSKPSRDMQEMTSNARQGFVQTAKSVLKIGQYPKRLKGSYGRIDCKRRGTLPHSFRQIAVMSRRRHVALHRSRSTLKTAAAAGVNWTHSHAHGRLRHALMFTYPIQICSRRTWRTDCIPVVRLVEAAQYSMQIAQIKIKLYCPPTEGFDYEVGSFHATETLVVKEIRVRIHYDDGGDGTLTEAAAWRAL